MTAEDIGALTLAILLAVADLAGPGRRRAALAKPTWRDLLNACDAQAQARATWAAGRFLLTFLGVMFLYLGVGRCESGDFLVAGIVAVHPVAMALRAYQAPSPYLAPPAPAGLHWSDIAARWIVGGVSCAVAYILCSTLGFWCALGVGFVIAAILAILAARRKGASR